MGSLSDSGLAGLAMRVARSHDLTKIIEFTQHARARATNVRLLKDCNVEVIHDPLQLLRVTLRADRGLVGFGKESHQVVAPHPGQDCAAQNKYVCC